MLIISLFFVAATLFFAIKFFVKTLPERIFIVVFSISSIYYGILGPWYWIEYHSAVFLNVDWSAIMPDLVQSFVLVYAVVVFCISVFSFKSKELCVFSQSEFNPKLISDFGAFVALGVFGCIYVYFVGGDLVGNGGELTEDGLVLIFYQFSDLIIGVLLFWLATKGLDFRFVLLTLFYCSFAVVSGYRYKIFLLIAPILIFAFVRGGANKILIRSGMVLMGILGIGFFSVMTISRVKFSGLDWDLLQNADSQDLIYGLFAETNLIFGLASSFSVFGYSENFVGVTPFVEIVAQFVPRFLYPDKDLYQHLKTAAWWLSNSQEGLDSGTAMPFFGEYYAAFGWGGMLLCVVLYSWLVVFLIKCVRAWSSTRDLYLIGSCIVAVEMGYFYFSRGAVAPIFRMFIFSYGPFFYFLMKYKSKPKIDSLFPPL